MTSQRFSKRYGLGGRKDALTYEDAPESLRKTLYFVLSRLGEGSQWECWLEYAISTVMRRPHKVNYDPEVADLNEPGMTSEWLNPEDKQELEVEVLTCEWFQFYDILEEIYSVVPGPDDYENLLNQQLEEEGIGWQMRKGRLERVGTEYTDQKIQQARILLRDDRFAGPDEQFEKALRFFNTRPEPDEENCVKEAISAVEGVARILSGDLKATLGQILNRHFRSKMPPALFKAFEGVWGYATNAPGARHAKVGNVQMPIADAELVLTLCAGMILYLVQLGEDNP